MVNNTYRAASFFLSLVILLTAGLAFPAVTSAAGTEPEDGLPLPSEWVPLVAGESHWYAFYYAGDGSQIQVQLQAELGDGVGFAVWTPEEIWHWGLGEYVEPVGRGSEDPYTEGTLVWSGSFPTAGTYHVVVEHSGSVQSYYQLGVGGEGVAVSAPAVSPASEPAVVQEETGTPGEPTGTLVFQTTFGGTFYTINVDWTR